MNSPGREPAGGSETWPRPGTAGHRPLAGDGASRRPKAVSSPRVEQKDGHEPLEGATEKSRRRGLNLGMIEAAQAVATSVDVREED